MPKMVANRALTLTRTRQDQPYKVQVAADQVFDFTDKEVEDLKAADVEAERLHNEQQNGLPGEKRVKYVPALREREVNPEANKPFVPPPLREVRGPAPTRTDKQAE